MKYWLLLVFSLSIFLTSFSQTRKPKSAPKDSLSSEAFIQMIDETLNAFYADYANQSNFDSIINALEYEPSYIPDFSDEVYCQRIQKINETSTFKLACNPTTLSVIRFFAKNRRNFTKIVMGRSALYFEMYEAYLAKYDLPKELKYLSVIESGLRPQVKSRAGALGLWQFMYGTGKMFGLKDNSYVDERMDPEKSTDAACRYLKKLHGTYNDWNLALAAYNAGPGNVNKAIRRSGGKLTYWEIRPFLPRETQGYVPNFIAATYLFTYHAEHNIKPAEAKTHFYQLDTICLSKGVHMSTISQLVDWEVDEIKLFNPVYKATYIPFSTPTQCVSGPLEKIGKLVSLEDSLYVLEDANYGSGKKSSSTSKVEETEEIAEVVMVKKTEVVDTTVVIYHTVERNEGLNLISQKYDVTVEDIRLWNGLKDNWINIGQRLKIFTVIQIGKEISVPAPKAIPTPTKVPAKQFHTVRKGEFFGRIASHYKLSISQLQKLNPGVRPDRITVGQKLRVK